MRGRRARTPQTALRVAASAWLALALAGAAPAPEANPANAPATPQHAASGETIAVDTSGGFARILVTFTNPTAVSASVADGVLTIKLAQPIAVDANGLAAKLGGYVASARRDASATTYRFALAATVALHTST